MFNNFCFAKKTKFKTVEGDFLDIEFKNRIEILNSYGIDTEGFQLLHAFSLSDVIFEYQSNSSKWATKMGWIKIAKKMSPLYIEQSWKGDFKLWQHILIRSIRGEYLHKGWIHDQDPEKAKLYILSNTL